MITRKTQAQARAALMQVKSAHHAQIMAGLQSGIAGRKADAEAEIAKDEAAALALANDAIYNAQRGAA